MSRASESESHTQDSVAELAAGCEDACDDTCETPNDDECDDGGPGSLTDGCGLGTDCTDCGPR